MIQTCSVGECIKHTKPTLNSRIANLVFNVGMIALIVTVHTIGGNSVFESQETLTDHCGLDLCRDLKKSSSFKSAQHTGIALF